MRAHTSVLLMALVVAGTIAPAGGQATPTPVTHGYRGAGQASGFIGDITDLAIAIDRFWAETFRAAEVPYVSPEIVLIDQRQETACGPVWPHTDPHYCPLDSTIYLGPEFLADKQASIGDYAPITVLAHEWGHHVQVLTQAPNSDSKTFEMQADCLAGVYTSDAENHGLLDPGDLSEAVILAKDVGDPLGLPQDHPNAHGINDERIKAFMRGYLNGLAACNLPLLAAGIPPTPAAPVPPQEAPAPPLTDILADTLPLAHATCFRVEDEGTLDLDALVGRLGGTDEARRQLQQWGWQASAFRTFACDTPPEGEAGWVRTDVHLFGDLASAQQAVDYFAAVRAEGETRTVTSPPAVGDHAAVLSGPVINGKEFTVYASRGPLLVRVTAVAPTGIPSANAISIAQAILEAPLPASQFPSPTPQPTLPVPEPLPTPRPTIPAPESTPTTGIVPYFPDVLPFSYTACFRADDPVVYDFPALVARFPGVPDAAETLQALGWQEGASRQFRCDDPPPGGVNWIDMSVHRFKDAASAAAAVPFYADTRVIDSRLETVPAPNIGNSATALTGPSDVGTEYTLYVSSGPLLLRVTGVAPVGDPERDVEQVMQTLFAGIQAHDLAGLFPTAIEISDGSPAQGPWYHFEVVEEGTQTAAEVAAWLGGDDAAARLEAWGWQGNAYRDYRMEAPGGPIEVTISIHEFAVGPLIALPDGSNLPGQLVALDAFADRWATLRRTTAERAGIIGPGVSRLTGSWKIEDEHEATLFVASYTWVIRVTATSSGDPQWDGVERVMDEVLARAEQSQGAVEA